MSKSVCQPDTTSTNSEMMAIKLFLFWVKVLNYKRNKNKNKNKKSMDDI